MKTNIKTVQTESAVAPSLRSIKRAATAIKKKTGLAHGKALDEASKKAGFPSWDSAEKTLSKKQTESIVPTESRAAGSDPGAIRAAWANLLETEIDRIPETLDSGLSSIERFRLDIWGERMSRFRSTETPHLCRCKANKERFVVRLGDLFLVHFGGTLHVMMTRASEEYWDRLQKDGHEGFFSPSSLSSSKDLDAIFIADKERGPWWAALRRFLPEIDVEWNEARKKELSEDAVKLSFGLK